MNSLLLAAVFLVQPYIGQAVVLLNFGLASVVIFEGFLSTVP